MSNQADMSQWQPPRPTEIDKKLRDDFRRLLKEYGVTTEETDPILAVLLRSFAAQIAEVYEQAAESIPMAILDELMSGLGMPELRARAAQAERDRLQMRPQQVEIGRGERREQSIAVF